MIICDICGNHDPGDLMYKWHPKIIRKGLSRVEDLCLACQDDMSAVLDELKEVHTNK